MSDDTTATDQPSQSPSVDTGEPIECQVSKWYHKRMGLMFLMVFAMGCWFLLDGAVRWPKKKEIWDQYTEMTGYGLQLVPEMNAAADLPASGQLLAIVGKGSSGLHARVFDEEQKQVIDLPESEFQGGKNTLKKLNEILKENWEVTELHPETKQEILSALSPAVDVSLKGSMKEKSPRYDEWKKLTEENDWDLDPEEYTSAKIETQWHFTYLMFAGAIGIVIVFLLNRKKVLKADSESIYLPNGKQMKFADAFRIDRRKWDNKGLAYVSYREGGDGAAKKATLDDLKYVGADKILARLMRNFEGELIDRIPDEDEDEESGRAAQVADSEDAIEADEDSPDGRSGDEKSE